MAEDRPLPPIWLMGMCYLSFGIFGGIMLISVPQLLAGAHVPEAKIAAITATGLMPGFIAFPFGPLLDWRFSRRTYAIVFAALQVLCTMGALLSLSNLPLLTALLFAGNLTGNLYFNAIGGWFGALVETEQKSAIGAWLTVGNIGGGGLIVSVAVGLMHVLPSPLGALAIGLIAAVPIPFFLLIRCPPADGRLAHEGFRDFARDVGALLRQSSVLWTLLLFLMPAASFALTNALGGFGADFRTSERVVSLLGGSGLVVAGVAGSLMIPVLSKKVQPRPLYLMVGGFGALFTLVLVVTPHVPMTFGLAMLGENVFQAAAFSVENMIILRTIGHNNPLAATQFGLLNAAVSLPLTYMQMLDGQGYGALGVNGSLLTDALLSGGAVLMLAGVLWVWRKRIPAI
jgi:PAT family beta-lactamase induction signal transducer AmpG